MKVYPILLVFFSLRLWGQSTAMEQITITDGLSQGMVFDLLQTRDGFLWVATKDGLNRYDGYNFKVFLNDPFDPYSIAENFVNSLLEDSKGRLWVGLRNLGVDIHDPATGRFHHFAFDFLEGPNQQGNPVEDMVETQDGAIWLLLTNKGLVRFAMPHDWEDAQKADSIMGYISHVVLPTPADPLQPEIPEVFKGLALRPNGELLVFSEKAVYVVDTKTQKAHVMEGFIPDKLMIRSLRTELHGEEVLWFARIADKNDNSKADIMRFHNGQLTSFPISDAQRNLWKRLLPGKAGNTWLVLGRNVWDLSPEETLDFGQPDLVFDAITTTWLHDRNGNYWTGTGGYGLRKINHLQGLFHAGAVDWTLDGVWAFEGRYFAKWVKEIREYDPLTNRYADHPAFADAPYLQINMAIEPSGAIWLLAASEGKSPKQMLLKYPPGSNGPAERIYEFEGGLNLRDPLLRTRDGRLWVAMQGAKFVRLDPATEQLDYFSADGLFGDAAGMVQPVALAEDADGVIWLGTISGLVKCTPTSQGVDFQLMQADLTNPNGLNNNSIACILPDANGLLWLGTKGGGINVLDPETGYCEHITTENGLLNNVVYGILSGNTPDGRDRADEFWCSTNRGLAKINVTQKEPFGFRVTTYTAELGLQDNEFNTNGYFKAGTGELIFSGINGLNRFFPEQLPQDTVPPPVYVVGIEINHRKAGLDILSCPPEKVVSLELNHDQNNLSFEFAALDFTAPSKNRYRYRLVGLDRDWVETGNRRFAHFSHLPPGRYEFRVQGNNGESAWADAPHPIKVVVLPPWWRSNLAYLCYLLLLFWAGWSAYRLQIRRIKEREQLAFEQRETERIRASEQMKTNFFNSVTHEFRTPLTLIIEPLRQLLKNPDDPDRGKKIYLAEKNSHRLLHLVNQLLDTAKLHSGNMALHHRRGNFQKAVRDRFEHFLPLAEKKGIALELSDHAGNLPEFDFDPDKIEILLNNLLSNAVKFTPTGGQVSIKLDHKTKLQGKNGSPEAAHSSGVEIQVSDTGIGIAPADLEKVFDRFYQADNQLTRIGEGTGIGLSLSKELAELMGGRIAVTSELGKGSTFVFWLPIKNGDVQVPLNSNVQEVADFSEGKDEKYSSRPDFTDERPLVLLVEDNAELREFIKQSIGEGWEIVEAVNGEEGVKKAVELVPELIISDVMMPLKDGYDLCDELKRNELTAHVPIILLTAKSAIESKLKGLRIGADDYLTKPFYTEELVTRMQNLVEMRRKLREYYSNQPIGETLKPGDNMSSLDWEFLQKFTQLLEDNLTDDSLGVEDFSKKMFLSRSQLHRKLKAITGRSATEFIRDFRLERAHAMLAKGEGLVGEIAIQVGFSNEKYFSTVFKEKYGMPPSQVLQR